jgi:hypothetical protein
MLCIPTIHGESGAPELVKTVADGELCRRRKELGEIACLGEIVGGTTLQLDVRIRGEFLGCRAEGEGREKGQDKGYFFHIGVLKDFRIIGKDNKINRKFEKRYKKADPGRNLL